MTDDSTAVVVSVPAVPRFLPVIRIAVAAAAVDGVRSVRRLDDLRLAVDELTACCMAAAVRGSRITLRVQPGHEDVRVEGRVRTGGTSPVLSDVGAALVAGTTSSHRLRTMGGIADFEFTVRAPETSA